MAQWGTRRRVMFIGQHGENKPELSMSISDDEDSKDEDKSIINESLAIPEFKKRKRRSRSRLQEVKAKQRQSSSCNRKQTKLESKIERWSAERYKLAEQSMLEVMKAEGASFASPIPRPVLRTAARKHIGDTGLLDHLLKHIDGKVAPGGVERFRRWFNANGIMEYWLENADLVNIRQEAGVQDPFWIPRSRSISAGLLTEDSLSAGDSLRLLKAEMAILKRDMQESAASKNLEENQANTEIVHKEVVKWQTKTEKRLDEITSCLKGMQDMLSGELETWKAKVEQQLADITNTLSSMQAPKQSKTSSSPASERWEDWLESTNLDNIQGDDLATWFDSNNLLNAEHDVAVPDLYLTTPPLRLNCGDNLIQEGIKSREQERLKETSKMKRDMLEPVLKKQEDDERNVTPDSSATFNSKSELDTSILSFQEMFRELFNWKAKTEQQLTEISNTVCGNKQALQLKD